MKRHIFLTVASLLLCITANAQFSIGYSVGYGSYKMGEMKPIMDLYFEMAVLQYPNLPFELTSNFPGNTTHTLELGYMLNKHELGLKATYMTTGGKVAYSDYSGEYRDRLIANGYRIAATYRYYVEAYRKKNIKLLVFGEISPGVTVSKLRSEKYIKIGDDMLKESPDSNIDFKGNGFTIQPQIGGKLYFTRNLAVVVTGGYDFEFGGKLSKFSTSPRLDWSGLRVNGGVSVTLP